MLLGLCREVSERKGERRSGTKEGRKVDGERRKQTEEGTQILSELSARLTKERQHSEVASEERQGGGPLQPAVFLSKQTADIWGGSSCLVAGFDVVRWSVKNSWPV